MKGRCKEATGTGEDGQGGASPLWGIYWNANTMPVGAMNQNQLA
jgi:hypothetical protein